MDIVTIVNELATCDTGFLRMDLGNQYPDIDFNLRIGPSSPPTC